MHLRDFSIVNEMIDPSLYKLMCKRFTFEFKVLKTDLKLFGILPFAFESLQIIRWICSLHFAPQSRRSDSTFLKITGI